MANIQITVKAPEAVKPHARRIAAEVAAALSSLGLRVTLGNGIEWPALDSNGTDAAVDRHRNLALVIDAVHKIYVGAP